MENYIVINGKKAELTPEQLKALGLETETKSPFERVKRNQSYFFINGTGGITETIDAYMNTDWMRLNVANYCTDGEMLQQQAYRETLNRLLWRYSMEHKGNEIAWNNGKSKYMIIYNNTDKRWQIDTNRWINVFGSVYFATREIAESALKEIIEPFMAEHPDFKL